MEDFNDSYFLIFNPVQNGENLYYSKLMYNNEELILQLNKTSIKLEYSKNNCKITPDENTINLIKAIDDHIIKNTSSNSSKWFGKDISEEDCKKLFKSCLEDNLLNCYVDEDCNCYKKNTSLDIQTLKDDEIGIPLIKCNAIIYTKGSFYVRWELIEVKIKSKPVKTDILLNEYSIMDVEEDKKPTDFYDNDKFIKKLDKLTLF